LRPAVTQEDKLTIPAVRASPPDAGTLYRTHVRQVARWAGRLAGPTLDVEDIVHEVFTIAHQRLSTFRGDSSAATWLFGITERVVRHRRRRARWRRWLSGSADESAGHLAATGPDPLRLVERNETARAVYRVLDRLPERDRRALILFELEELTAEEVAQLLGIRAANARLRLHRARARFLRLFEKLERDQTNQDERSDDHVSQRQGT
jgi:RNA polymerase sigma-70 factor (ECF subfamily)